MSRSNQKERIKSKQTDKQNRQTNRTFCHFCHRYCSQLHYCETKKLFRQEDYNMFMVLEGEDEENLTVVQRYNNKLNMRECQIINAEAWFKRRHDEELVLAEEKQHPASRCLITTEQHRKEKIKQKPEDKGKEWMNSSNQELEETEERAKIAALNLAEFRKAQQETKSWSFELGHHWK